MGINMIQSLVRSMELLEILKQPPFSYSIAELSKSTDLPPSTIHRILQTFCSMNFVIRDELSHTYKLGPACISIGQAASGNVQLRDSALTVLRKLSAKIHEDCYLIIRVENKGLVLDKIDGPNHLKVVEQFGFELDLHCGAIRKTLLAYQTPDYIEHYMNDVLTRADVFPKTDAGMLRKVLGDIRENGYSVSDSEYVNDAIGVGAPIFDINHKIIASIGIIAPKSRITTPEQLDRTVSEIKDAASQISYYMGVSITK